MPLAGLVHCSCSLQGHSYPARDKIFCRGWIPRYTEMYLPEMCQWQAELAQTERVLNRRDLAVD